MEKMGIVSFIGVTIPESFLAALILIIMIDGRRYLKINDTHNILKILLLTAIFAAQTYFVRMISPNQGINLLIQCVVYAAMIKCVYWGSFDLKNVIVKILIYALAYVGFELLVGAAVVAAGLTIEEVYRTDYIRILYTIPTRLTQLIALITLYRMAGENYIFRDYKKIKWQTLAIIVMLLVVEGSLICTFLAISGIINTIQKVSIILNLVFLSAVNIFVVNLVRNVADSVYMKCYRQGRGME